MLGQRISVAALRRAAQVNDSSVKPSSRGLSEPQPHVRRDAVAASPASQ